MTARPDSDKYFYVSKYVFVKKNLDERRKEKLTTLWSWHKFSTFLCFFMVPDDLKNFFLSTCPTTIKYTQAVLVLWINFLLVSS